LRHRCTVEEKIIHEWEGIFSIKARFAWLKKDGEEATRINNWRPLVWVGLMALEDLVFTPPRALGSYRPSTRKKMSAQRAGGNNPCVIARAVHSKDDICALVSLVWDRWQTDPLLYRGIADFCRHIKEGFPEWRYCFADEFVGMTQAKKTHAIIAKATGSSASSVSSWLRKCRGLRISIGQDNPETKRKLSASAAYALGKRRITKPHRELLALVKEYDASASIEFIISNGHKSRFFDIYSPKFNACIEMHGRVWHDVSATTSSLLSICSKNVENDKAKYQMAIESGYRHIVFWDDEASGWREKLENFIEDQIS